MIYVTAIMSPHHVCLNVLSFDSFMPCPVIILFLNVIYILPIGLSSGVCLYCLQAANVITVDNLKTSSVGLMKS